MNSNPANTSHITSLFRSHLSERMKHAEEILDGVGYDSLILGSGKPHIYFLDDQAAPFHCDPFFSHWCPDNGPYHLLHFSVGMQKPVLYYYQPDDFWHAQTSLKEDFWTECFEIKEMKTPHQAWNELRFLNNALFIGEDKKPACVHGVKANCELTLARFNWTRKFKSDYEIYCLSEANKLASLGHIAAREAFHQGASELDIDLSYLKATRLHSRDLPYSSIVALGANAAVLHYQHKQITYNGEQSFLIDSGAKFFNYCADITRTYALPSAHPVFKQLLTKLNDFQQQLCQQIKPHLSFPELHNEATRGIGKILEEEKIINVNGDYESARERGLIRPFFPHGLGHMLGIQVHDVGGKQADINGNVIKPHKNIKSSLRYYAGLEVSQVVTIEPGIYFIPLLLQEKKNSPDSHLYNWPLIEELLPLGGIRIEDNVVVTETGSKNLTREFLP